MSELIRTIPLIAVHQDAPRLDFWQKGGQQLDVSSVFLDNLNVELYTRFEDGKIKYNKGEKEKKTNRLLKSNSGYGLLGVVDVGKNTEEEYRGWTDHAVVTEIIVFCRHLIRGHELSPKGLPDWSPKGEAYDLWEEEFRRQDSHDVPISEGLLVVDRHGIVSPLCNKPVLKEDDPIEIVSSFKKNRGVLIYGLSEDKETVDAKANEMIEAEAQRRNADSRGLLLSEPSLRETTVILNDQDSPLRGRKLRRANGNTKKK